MQKLGAVLGVCLVACGSPPEIVTAPPPPVPAHDAGDAGAVAERGFENPGGMWLPQQLVQHRETLERLGLQIPPEDLSDPLKHPLSAVVSLGGCSASFVSDKGLVITNHHCVTGALQHNSTPEQNLLQDGFRAQGPDDERSIGPTGRVYVTQTFTDVSERMRKGLDAIADDKARADELEKREKELVLECERDKPAIRCDLASYYGGRQYLLIERLEIKDVRLVYAPAAGIGVYGGEIDNWRWPRHTGDFALYRAYVGKDGKPAEFSKDNVAYRPKSHLEIATRPLRPADLVFVAGYPGRTYRLTTAEEVEEVVDWYYPRRLELFKDYLELIERVGKQSPEIAIKATSLQRGLSNAQTYTRGSLEGLTKGGAATDRRKRDEALRAFIDADAERKRRYGDVFPKLASAFDKRKQTRDLDAALDEISRLPSLLAAAITIVRMAEERPKKDAEREPAFQQRNWERLRQEQRALAKRYARPLDSALLTLALTRSESLLTNAADEKLVLSPFGIGAASEIERRVKDIYDKTRLEDEKLRLRLLDKATSAELAASRDPLLRAAVLLWPALRAKIDREDALSGALALVRPEYVGALSELTPEPLAPDANGTLRVTYGTVRGYRPSPEAPLYEPFTKLAGVVEKHTGKDPFAAPARLLELHEEKQLGPYVDPKLGDVPVNFLADLDITGGNSGSPTLDAEGKLVGLAFDGNYEAMASDYVFMPDITRSIHVDIRYALWVMDAVDGVDWVLSEMGVKPALP